MKNGESPINPVYHCDGSIMGDNPHSDAPNYLRQAKALTGLTKREYFAAMALQGILSNSHYAKCLESNIWKPAQGETGKLAVEMADELLKEL